MTGCTRESQRCEFWTQGEEYLRPACCTQHLKDLLFYTHDLLRRHGIPHWLDFGAVLGAVRGGSSSLGTGMWTLAFCATIWNACACWKTKSPAPAII